jgi:hypothetical protein
MDSYQINWFSGIRKSARSLKGFLMGIKKKITNFKPDLPDLIKSAIVD